MNTPQENGHRPTFRVNKDIREIQGPDKTTVFAEGAHDTTPQDIGENSREQTHSEEIVFSAPQEESENLPTMSFNRERRTVKIGNNTFPIQYQIHWRILLELARNPQGLFNEDIKRLSPNKHLNISQTIRQLRKALKQDVNSERPIINHEYDENGRRRYRLNAEVTNRKTGQPEENQKKLPSEFDAVTYVLGSIIDGKTDTLSSKPLKTWSPRESSSETVDSDTIDSFLRTVEKLWNKGSGFTSEKEAYAAEFCKAARIKGFDIRSIANELANRFDVNVPKRYLKKK